MISLRTLGECAIEVGDRRVGPESEHVFALLLYLAIERGKHVGRGTLVERFWPDTSDAKARHCLRQTLYKLRLLGVPLTSTPSHVEVGESEVTGDFLLLADRGLVDVDRLRVGGAAFGEFLPGYAPHFSSSFTEWLESKRDFVHAQVRRALSTALVACRSAHRWADVDAVARHCLRLDPLNEEATLALAEATALTGSKAQAISMLDRFVAELGVDAGDIRLPATLLRKRIAERLPARQYTAASDALFVGRDDDLAMLGALLEAVRGGQGRSCLLWGEAGIGKSRLAAECAKGASLQGVRVQRVACQASDAERPLSIFVDVVPKLQALPGALGCAPQSVAYLRRLTEHDRRPAPSEDAQDAAYLHGCIRRAVLDLVDALAEEAPLLLVVEDVHWLDAQSWDLLREMIDWAADRRLCVLLTSRTATPTERRAPPLLPRRMATHRLRSLDAGAAGSLLDAIVRDHKRALDPDYRAWCVGVSEGNPLFVRELASQWIETGDATKVPATLSSVLAERLARLRPASLRLLQASAILGRNSTFERLEGVTDYKKYELLDGVEELEGAGLLSADGSGVRPRHELIARAALDRINEGARRLLHRNAARLLEAEIEATKGASLLWDYTAHCRSAGEPHHVARVVTAVGEHLIEVGLPAEAAAVYERALGDAESSTQKYPLALGLCKALRLAGLSRQALAALRNLAELQSLLSPLATTHTEEELHRLEAEWRVGFGADTVLERVMTCVDDDRTSAAHRVQSAVLAIRIADNLADDGALRRAYSCIRSLTAQATTTDRSVLTSHLIYHTILGKLKSASAFGARLVALERNSPSPRSLVRALGYYYVPALYLGQFDAAEQSLREALTIAERFRFAAAAMSAAEGLCHLALERGQEALAQRWFREAVGWSHSAEDARIGSQLSYAATRLALLGGDPVSAQHSLKFDPQTAPFDTDTRGRMALLALWTLVHARSIGSLDWSRLRDELLALHLRLRVRGGQDFPVYCMCKSLLERDQNEMAYSLLREYATIHRRERYSLPSYFEEISEP